MRAQSLVAALPLFSLATAHAGHHHKRANVVSTPEALNTTPTNLIPNGPGGPTLYYNGTGPVPGYDVTSPDPNPLPMLTTSEIEQNIINEVVGLSTATAGMSSGCDQCIAITELLHVATLTLPVDTVTNILIGICEAVPAVQKTIYAASCEAEFAGVGNLGPYYYQMLRFMTAATGDYVAWCAYNWDACPAPATVLVDESKYFKPKPKHLKPAPAASGKTFDVLHLTDFHLDPRYMVTAEANCSDYLCCRPYSVNEDLETTSTNASVPASRWGYLYCDTPADLGLSVFSMMNQFVNRKDIAFSIYTGDLVSHDNDDQISQDYVMYEEQSTFETFKSELGNSPVYATLGNHDTVPYALFAPDFMRVNGSDMFAWNYDLLSSLWSEAGWLDNQTAEYAKTHYGAYATTTKHNLKIISINTDFWYPSNFFNYINYTNPDPSGILAFLADELQKSEDAHQRAWVIGHIPSGYDGSNALPNPTALFQSIVRRFSPTTIAGIFFGHNHEDQMNLYYDFLPDSLINGTLRNTSMIDYSQPLMPGYIAPSVTPLSGLNSGWRVMAIDSGSLEVVNVKTFFANVSESNSWTAPVWQLEYDTRAAYTPALHNYGGWPTHAPLNATFWHRVTEAMLHNTTLVEMYNLYETKSSVDTESCSTQACAEAKVCYIRSGTAEAGRACPQDAGPF